LGCKRLENDTTAGSPAASSVKLKQPRKGAHTPALEGKILGAHFPMGGKQTPKGFARTYITRIFMRFDPIEYPSTYSQISRGEQEFIMFSLYFGRQIWMNKNVVR
ncbi:MAG TPA: hypothetical protein V6D06_01350, partial [Trichocoleus sp.]